MSASGKSSSLGWVTWSSLGLGATGLGQFVLLAVLGRKLRDDPEAFGVVTATMVVIGIGRVIHSAIGPALVQREELRKEHVTSAFALGVHSAFAMALVTALCAPLVAAFFDDDGLTPVMRWLSLLFVCQAPGLVPEALLQREMRMRSLGLAEASAVLLGYLPVGIGLALFGAGVWALVGAILAQAIVKAGMLVAQRPHERSLRLHPVATREIVRYSGGVASAGLCNYAASQGDNVVVGRCMSTAALGVYSRAYQLMVMPAMFLGEVVDRIVFPLLSRVQNDKDQLRTAYGRGVSLIASVMTPFAALGVALAPEIVVLVLGDGWLEVVLPFQVLMSGLVFRTGYKISDMLARATGTVYARAWRQAIFAGLIAAGALAGVAHGVVGVAVGVVAALAANYLMMAWLSIATTGLSWFRFFALHGRGLLLGLLFGGVAHGVAEVLRERDASPWLVAPVAATAALLGFAIAAWSRPSLVLGADGLWLLHTLTGRGSAAAVQRGASAPR